MQKDLVYDYEAITQAFPWEGLFSKKSKKRILDIGCGTGRWLAEIQRFLHEKNIKTSVTCDLLDPSRRVLELAKKNIKPPWKFGEKYPISIRFADIPEENYDIIWAMHSFYAIPKYELRRVLRECRNLLKPEGSLFIVQSSESSFYTSCYKNFRKEFALETPEQYITAEDLSKALKTPHKIIRFSYEEKIPTEKLDHFILEECIGNSFNRDHNLGIPKSLSEIRPSSSFKLFLDNFFNGNLYAFPQEVQLIIFNKEEL